MPGSGNNVSLELNTKALKPFLVQNDTYGSDPMPPSQHAQHSSLQQEHRVYGMQWLLVTFVQVLGLV